MAIALPKDTRDTLGPDARACDSRSLLFDRFADPEAKQETRQAWFKRVVSLKPRLEKIDAWQSWLCAGGLSLKAEDILFGRLECRLMVNMAGGVMENAGLCLDRFGLPYIPGSAVKGCARRMAIQQLLEADTRQAKTDLLVRIALAFGWGEQDWSAAKKDGRFKSDFAYSVGVDLWPAVSGDAQSRLPKTDHFAGAVSFLPAYSVDVSGTTLPLRLPLLGALELDVVTCHHPDYYQDKKPVATDDEDPNPVIFPAIAAGHVFAFVVLPLRNCPDTLLKQVRRWLADGLATFGLGAKTAAGYGWFDCSDEIQRSVTEAIARREKQETERRQKEAETAALKAKEEAERKRKEEDKAALASLSPDQREDYMVARLSDDQFRSALDNFGKKTPEEQKAIVRAFRLPADSAGSRRSFWEDLKAKAQRKGGKLAQTEQTIRQLSKQMYPGKEGKMP